MSTRREGRVRDRLLHVLGRTFLHSVPRPAYARAQRSTAISSSEVSSMSPPINRENLRDALVALVIATGLAWVVAIFRGCAANPPPLVAHITALWLPSPGAL
jgi:hypothetical protein